MVIPRFDMLSVFGVEPCPNCSNSGYVFTSTSTVPHCSYEKAQEMMVRKKLYGDY